MRSEFIEYAKRELGHWYREDTLKNRTVKRILILEWLKEKYNLTADQRFSMSVKEVYRAYSRGIYG